MNRQAHVAFLASLALLACGNLAFRQATAYSWTLHPKKGETARFRQNLQLDSELEAANLHIVINTVTKQEVKDVVPTGDATWIVTTESVKTSVNGKPLPPSGPPYSTTTLVVSKTGQLLKRTMENASKTNQKLSEIGAMFSVTPTPPQPVKAGDSWKTEIANRVVPGKKVTMLSTLIGPGRVLGLDALKVRTKIDIPTTADGSEDNTVHVEGVYVIEPKTGRILQAAYTAQNMEIELGPDKTLTVKALTRLARIVPGVNDEDDSADPTEKGKEEKKGSRP
jgi:hypothetical protein